MSVYDQPITSYNNTTIHDRIIAEIINLIDPMDVPVIARLGLDSARSKFRIGGDGTKIEILEDEYAATSATAAQGTTITTSTLTITFADGSVLKPGMILEHGGEQVVVSSISTNAVTVHSRSYGGTNTTHAATSVWQIVGMARLEGADADYGPIMDVTAPYNYTSIYEESVKVTGTEAAIDHLGVGDMFEYQMAKKVKEQLRLLNRGFYHSVRAAGSATTPRSFGGVGTYVTDNSSSITTTLTKAALDNLAESIFNDGGMPDLLILPPNGWKTLRGLLDSSSFIRLGQENTMFGMRNIARANLFAYDNIEILVDRWCPDTKAYLLDSDKVGFYTLRPFQQYGIYRKGDYIAGELVGEFSLLIANDKAHGYVTTSASAL